MTNKTRFRKATCVAGLALISTFALQSNAGAQQSNRSNGFAKILQGLSTAAAGGGSVLGRWQGGKTENDPIHGGYLNLSFTFIFAADGSYQEAAYMGGRQVMFASGAYQQSGNTLVFTPERCEFASSEIGQVVKFFPIPNETAAQEAISLSRFAGGSQLSLKDLSSGEDWGLKPAGVM